MVIFIVSTYGEGEPTDNAKEFYGWLMDGMQDQLSLQTLKFAVFGLGNSTHEWFSQCGKNIDKRLGELGANRIFPFTPGDDDKEYFFKFFLLNFTDWLEKALKAISNCGKKKL